MSSPRRMLPSRGVYRALRDCLGSSRECNTRLWCASVPRAFPVLPGSVSGHFVSPSTWGPLCHGGTAWGCTLADVCGAPGQQTGTWQQPQVAPPNTA